MFVTISIYVYKTKQATHLPQMDVCGMNNLHFKVITAIRVSALDFDHSAPDGWGTPAWGYLIMQMVSLFRFSTRDLRLERCNMDSRHRPQYIN